ncbi:hypothetical protein [Erythrobacter sp.]|uniref:hypothetical protein n=1 Tax=Erythrobacter sp. TaxID=1042 RepID=UPI001425CD98|nr:hypothetical protein [Erythrobacter sp.]QIQ85893.1 MAG: hypothetical protein G9473_03720 [Erythrobacter sp.]
MSVRRCASAFAALVPAALLLTAPLSAQDDAQYTAQDDLDCAIVISMVLGTLGDNASAEQQKGLVGGLSYFVGRYEARSDRPLETAMLERYRVLRDQDVSARQKVCGARMQGMGQRMQAAGSAISALEDQSPVQ